MPLELVIGGGVVLVIVLLMVWLRGETKASAGSKAEAKVSEDALAAMQEGDKREMESLDLTHEQRIRIMQERSARRAEALSRAKSGSDAGDS